MKHKKIKSSKLNENIYTDSNDSFSKNYINNNSSRQSLIQLTREKFRQLAINENIKYNRVPNKKEIEFPIPVKENITIPKSIDTSYDSSTSIETMKPKNYKCFSSNRTSDIIKISLPEGAENVKSFNDFSESIFLLDPQKNTYMCPVQGCNKEFPSLSRIKRHYIIHTDIKPFKCKNKECNRRFSRKDNMLQHYRMHCPYTYH